jgi:hypothetical protein
VEWAATGKVTQKVPATFPTANDVSFRVDLAAIDPAYLNGASSPVIVQPSKGMAVRAPAHTATSPKP